MLSKCLLSCFAVVFAFSNAFADCTAVVKVDNISSENDNVVLIVRVFASEKNYSRTVYYSIFGEVGATGLFGTAKTTPISSIESITVGSGDEYADDEVEIPVPAGDPVSPARIKQVLVTGCYQK